MVSNQVLDDANDFNSGVDRSAEKEEEAEIAESATHALLRVAGMVSQSVGDTAKNPNQTSNGGARGTFQAGWQKKKKSRKLNKVS